ncbi:hypothetical protein [Streptococcus pantholopis]|uniref:Uncharacterized protein n=1 Tax=Streptococcus pantholopis TaxID=1811193 RepID=A0A172Q654_9STRE|nr:hypothetical protein A0O21_02280 [Streptococcus pantholopis]
MRRFSIILLILTVENPKIGVAVENALQFEDVSAQVAKRLFILQKEREYFFCGIMGVSKD